MERLTPKDLHPYEVKNFVDKFNDKGDDPYFRSKVIDKLWEYEEAEEQGLLVRLPCKVGDKIWVLSDENFVFPREINHVEVYEDEIIFCEASVDGDICSWNNIVKSTPNYCDDFFFLTETEALQALKERE